MTHTTSRIARIVAICVVAGCANFFAYSKDVHLPTQPSPESDFKVDITEDGTGAVITEYIGADTAVYIPATIEGFPVKQVNMQVPARVTALVMSEGCEYVRINNSTNIVALSLPDSVLSFFLWYTKISEFVVPANVETMGSLPATLEKVGFRGAPEYIDGFSGTKITSIDIPEGVQTIGDKAFQSCEHLKSVSLPSTLKKIDQEAFSGCTSLESIALPSNFETLGDSAFSGCSNLKEVTIPSLAAIGAEVFNKTAVESITLPDNLKDIGSAFSGYTSLKTITLPNRLEVIPENAFRGCTSLESVTFPGTLKEIEASTFYNCSNLKELIIPEGLSKVNFNYSIYHWGELPQFSGCSSLSLASRARLRKLGYTGEF